MIAIKVVVKQTWKTDFYLHEENVFLRQNNLATKWLFVWVYVNDIFVESWDERMFVKMIKCTSELGHHAESMILCQYQSEVDYVTAFKALEERNCFDAMDSLYPFLWDVTILEYAVSMHNKKGEISRKKKALDTISQLEINTNNNEEILREAQAARRSAFLRYMAANYLK